MNSESLKRIAYRKHEAAQALGISIRTLDAWLADVNPPPHFRRGNVLLFPHNELLAWMQIQARSGENAEKID